MTGGRFEDYWLSSLRPGTPPDLIEHWRRYVLSGRQRGEAVVELLVSQVSLPGSRALDIGCGYGGTCITLAQRGAQVTGIDVDNVYLEGARLWASEQRPAVHVSFLQSAVEHLPFPDACFDVVVCADLMEHVASHSLAVREISRVLAERGVAYVSFPNRLSPHNLRADPHYQMFGVCLLPRRLGAWYVTRFRKRSPTYSVGQFPVATQLRRLCAHRRMVVVWQNPVLRRSLGFLTPVVRSVRDCTYPKVEWILRKDLRLGRQP